MESCFFTANFVPNFAVKGGECGEIMVKLQKSPHFTAYYSHHPCTDLNLSPPEFHALPLPLRNVSLKFSIFVLNLIQVHSTFCKTHALNFCKISGEIKNFSGEIW